MPTDLNDLRTLSRSRIDVGRAAPASAPGEVPRPRFRWGTRVVLPGAVLLCALGLLAYVAQDSLLPRREVRVIPVVVKSGVESSAGVTVQAPGWLEPDPYPIAVSALTDGIVEEVLVLEGEAVKKGQVVARLVDDDARLARDRAAANLAEKRAALEAAQRQWDNPVARTQAVAVAEAMAEETRAELKKLESDVAAEVATAEELKEEYLRRERLRESSAAAGLEIMQAQRRYESQRARLAAAKAQKPVLEQQLRQREADLVAAREHLKLRIEEAQALAAAKAAADSAEVAWREASLRHERTQVRSPSDGVVMTRLAEPGAKLMIASDHPQSAQAVRLYDPRRLQVRVDVPLADAAKISVGQEAKVVVHVLPDREFRGKVSRISGEADLAKNTLQVKVAITDPSPELRPEMLTRVKFVAPATTSSTGPAQLVFAPEHLLVREGDAAKAWVVDAGRGVATLRAVQVGETRHNGWVSVRSGLHAGDQLIAETTGLSEGKKVKVVGEAQSAPSTRHSALSAEGGQHGVH